MNGFSVDLVRPDHEEVAWLEEWTLQTPGSINTVLRTLVLALVLQNKETGHQGEERSRSIDNCQSTLKFYQFQEFTRCLFWYALDGDRSFEAGDGEAG